MFPYSAADLDRFRQVQRLAYDIAQQVEEQLEVGMTEVEVCMLLATAQADHGVGQVFHEPFAWVGRRTVLGSDWVAPFLRGRAAGGSLLGGQRAGRTGHERGDGAHPSPVSPFSPTSVTIAEGLPVIVDLAPVVGGVSSDIGYSCVVGANRLFNDLDRALPRIRSFLLEGVRAGESLRTLYRELDFLLAQRGWENCHQHYPDRALGHMVFPLGEEPERPSPLPGFGTAAAEGLLAAGVAAVEGGTSYPVWNDTSYSHYRAAPGLWAVEPHIGRGTVGVKFEEILVVTEDDAFWLDDHLPHSQRWAAAGYSIEPLARL
jgi:Xaa-Pro aminopeptidase